MKNVRLVIDRDEVYYEKKKPINEFYIPLIALTFSGIIFASLTLGFGIYINRFTGEVSWEYDINNPHSEYDYLYINPLSQFGERWQVGALVIIGYYIGISCLIYLYFDYLKWKWKNIPIMYRYEEKRKS